MFAWFLILKNTENFFYVLPVSIPLILLLHLPMFSIVFFSSKNYLICKLNLIFFKLVTWDYYRILPKNLIQLKEVI